MPQTRFKGVSLSWLRLSSIHSHHPPFPTQAMSSEPPLRDLRKMHEVSERLRKRSLPGGEDESPSKKRKPDTPSAMVTRRRAHELQVRFFDQNPNPYVHMFP